jgi:signal transduction histidine kinase/ActR/RegA family two-component response regulator
MSLWRRIGRRQAGVNVARGVSQAVLENASRDDLCREVHRVLRDELAGKVDRFGVWLAPEGEYNSAVDPQSFRGRFWDAAAHSDANDDLPEWNVLANLGSLPEELLIKFAPIEKEVSSRADLTLAAASGMRRVLWVPVRLDEQLHGVLFAATRRKNVSVPREAMVRVAAELAVALGFEKRSASLYSALGEQAFQTKTLAQITEKLPLDRILLEIVNDCLHCAPGGKPIGPFAMLGLLSRRTGEGESLEATLDFLWTAGDRLWARSAMSEPIASIWREAVATGKITGHEIRAPWTYQDLARVIAIPLVSPNATAGALVAGLQNSAATLATLERLELRAKLAAIALEALQEKAPAGKAVEPAAFFMDHTAESWFLLDPDLEVIHASKAGRKLLSLAARAPHHGNGAPSAKATTSLGTAAQLFPPKQWQRLAAWMREILGEVKSAAAHSRDAQLRAGVAVRLHAARLADRKLSVFLQSVAQEQAAESRADIRLKSLMEWVDHGVVIFGEHDQVQAANLAFSQLFGLAPSEMERTRSLRELVAAIAPRVREPDHFAKRWWYTARGADVSSHEEIQVTQPVPRTLQRLSRPLVERSGNRIGRLELYKDVTAQETLRAKLRKNERLVSIGEKVSGVAHELSNPLTAILGYAQRLLAKAEGSARREDIQRIFSEAERASSIVRQLLGITSESAPELRPLNLNSLIHRTVEMHRFQLASEKIHVELDLAEDLPQMLGDTGQLQQVLENLIANSRHALLELQRPGTISFRTRLADSGRILLEVSDSGPGIPEALRHRIFDPFFTTKPAGIGNGLGLSIVAGLVRHHGGHIYLNNAVTAGASFLMDFPAVAPEAPALLSELPPALTVAHARPRGGRVLVVEDEQTVAQLIADMLSDLGYTSEVQQDARRALISALHRDYELVVCDVKMPGLDGPHLYRALLEAGSSLTSRFLFVTGDVLGAATREFLQQYGLPYIAKPFRVEEFTEKVAVVLREAAAPAGSASSNPSPSRKNLVKHG